MTSKLDKDRGDYENDKFAHIQITKCHSNINSCTSKKDLEPMCLITKNKRLFLKGK